MRVFGESSFNPFIAPACKISELKDARTRLKNRTVSGLITNLFAVLCVLIKILSLASVKKEEEEKEREKKEKEKRA